MKTNDLSPMNLTFELDMLKLITCNLVRDYVDMLNQHINIVLIRNGSKLFEKCQNGVKKAHPTDDFFNRNNQNSQIKFEKGQNCADNVKRSSFGQILCRKGQNFQKRSKGHLLD